MKISENKKKLIVLTGTTCSEKSSTALNLYDLIKSEIISADSMLVYRDFDIGSAKPPISVRKKVKHHLIDVVSPLEEFNAWEYMRTSREIIKKSEIKNFIIVGGTQLYIKALLEGLDIDISKDNEIRNSIVNDFKNKGLEYLYSKLKKIDPEGAKSISSNDKQRVIRYLEINYSTGMRVSEIFLRNTKQRLQNIRYIKVAMSIEKDYLNKKIDERVDKMIKDGLVDEVKRLREIYPLNIKPFRSIGYLEINKYLNSDITLENAVELIKIRTKQFAKRQRTWLRKDSEINWFDKYEDLITFSTKYGIS